MASFGNPQSDKRSNVTSSHIVGTYAGNYKARGSLEKAGYTLSPDPEAILRTYYSVPEDRLKSSVTYEKPI